MTFREPVQPANYRLSKESWDEIVEAYRNGATARSLAVKWKVAPGSVYYHACRDGWGKKTNGDDRARAHARAMEAREAKRAEPPPPLTPPETGAEAATDARTLGRRVLRGLARALDQGRLEEARALGALAASLGRIPEQDRDRVDWADFARAATDRTAALELSFDGEEEETTSPHPAKVEFWRRMTGSTAAEPRRVMAEAFWMMLEGRLARLRAPDPASKTGRSAV
ncbi:hypothetical protein ACO2Q1_14185 [Brevundimonas sp. VNH65]|uniref:hypothetical protein n=1 Tax=Brevundimonas sp. VNH65 TaxID=3400917 RepID=UPI003C095A39